MSRDIEIHRQALRNLDREIRSLNSLCKTPSEKPPKPKIPPLEREKNRLSLAKKTRIYTTSFLLAVVLWYIIVRLI